ncbi:PhoU family transcriptional regulator [Haloarcula rubripromontorii]|uniref:PhoU family transcriptional regulator n=1 Tax=Haloarcula rubripromontorii TaxID=1705562 RepID=A0A0M9AGC2_9EURY|nr:Lrp/AsnC family transcriptional regulator [Haloarcula rubripromontorii]KOX91439.1 PhoU family transcriptional regulator [Haloarcula rubripromontorii]NLV08318.1 winged helix-turn-helix transcriptional regulator [Haloarcula rubripromontorii]
MSRQLWQRPLAATQQGRDATRAQIIEVIDRSAPETKSELATAVGISEQYCSELLQSLKADGVVQKGYVVDDTALYDNATGISRLHGEDDPGVDGTPDDHKGMLPPSDRGPAVLSLLKRLEAVTTSQYEAARTAFGGNEPEQSADTLESLTNERYFAVVSELKSYTLTTDWPGNRVAADLATIATNLEIVGDRACFIADVVDERAAPSAGVVTERLQDIFAAGDRINDHFSAILFDCDLSAYPDLRSEEETVHRDLDELFELVTAYDMELYGYLVTVTRALERAIYYWADAAELAVTLHSGIHPDHALD